MTQRSSQSPVQHPNETGTGNPPVNRQSEFIGLLSQNYRSLYAFVISLGADVHQADDIMQEVSILLWDQFDRFDPETSFLRWGRGYVRNVFRNHRRTLWKKRCLFSPELIERLFETQCAAEELLNVRLNSLQRCLAQLPRSEQKLVKSFYEKKNTLTETARHSGKTPNALHKAVSRIRLKLSLCIDRQMGIERD